ncbi:site-specific integrase [Hyphomonadaceae bacterium ML37]|nr:site-specific integrase [Hyphomonadaceae bacterium ML37]
MRNLAPDPSKRLEIPDPGQSALYLIVQPSGRKSWAVRYRQNDRSRKLTLGRFPDLGLAEAREMTVKALERIERGADPAQEKAQRRRETGAAGHKRGDTVSALVAEYLKLRPRQKAIRSIGEVKRIFDVYVLPVIGSRPVAKLTKRDVLDVLDILADRPAMANRTFEALRALLNWAIQRDWIAASPMAGMEKPFESKSRDRVLSADEVRWFWQATGAMGYPFGDALRVCLLTGQRVGEVTGMTRREIDGDTWVIPPERAKNGEAHAIPLAPAVAAIIEAAPVIGDRALVFTTTGDTPISGRSKAKARLDRLMAEAAAKERGSPVEIAPFRIHDLRRTAASGMAEIRIPPHFIEAVLNHRTGIIKGIARVYNRFDYATEKREALEAWERRVGAIVSGEAPANVIELEARR